MVVIKIGGLSHLPHSPIIITMIDNPGKSSKPEVASNQKAAGGQRKGRKHEASDLVPTTVPGQVPRKLPARTNKGSWTQKVPGKVPGQTKSLIKYC